VTDRDVTVILVSGVLVINLLANVRQEAVLRWREAKTSGESYTPAAALHIIAVNSRRDRGRVKSKSSPPSRRKSALGYHRGLSSTPTPDRCYSVGR